MSNLIEKITLIGNIFDDIASAISEKGISIGQCDGPETYADKIRQIKVCDHQEEPDEPTLPAATLCDYNSITMEAEGGTKEVLVSYLRYKFISEPSITYVSGSDWLKIQTLSSGSISTYQLIVTKNELTTNRVAKITFACEDDLTVAKHVLTLTQKAVVEEVYPVTVTCLTGSSVEIPSEGSNFKVSVQYKNATTIDTPSVTSDWITLDNTEENIQDENTTVVDYTFSASKNETADRSKVLMFSARGKENSTDSANVTVSQKKVVTPESVITFELKIEPESLTIYQGDTGSFMLKADKYIDGVFDKTIVATTDATWRSSDSSILSVVRGEVTGLAIGNAAAIATYQGRTISGTVNVIARPPEPVCKVTLNPSAVSLGYQAGSTATVYATFENATPYDVVSNENCQITYLEQEDTNRHSYQIKSLKNGGTSDLTSYVQIKYTNTLTNQVASINVPVTIAHAPSATISVSPTSVNFTSGGGNKTVTVSVTNTDTYYVVNEDLDWLTASISGNTVTLVANPNESTASRSGKVIISCVGLDEVEKQAWVNVTQDGKVIIDEPQPMYYGYISKDLRQKYNLTNAIGYSGITEACILEAVDLGTIKKIDEATTMGKTSFGVVPKYSMLLIAVPSGEYVVKLDDAFGNKVNFTFDPCSNGEHSINIDEASYSLYGEYQNSDLSDNKWFYIDKK